MGFARRVVRKSVRRATPRPVHQVMRPARTVKNAVTPRPVKQVSRATYTMRHLVGATENAIIGAALYPPRRRRGFWSWLTGRTSIQPDRKPERPASVPARWPNIDPSGGVRRPTVPQLPPAARHAPVPQPRPGRVEPWPARQGFRTPPPASAAARQRQPQQAVRPPSSASQWELDMRRRTGLGDGSRNQ
jgi:hypothetical protein